MIQSSLAATAGAGSDLGDDGEADSTPGQVRRRGFPRALAAEALLSAEGLDVDGLLSPLAVLDRTEVGGPLPSAVDRTDVGGSALLTRTLLFQVGVLGLCLALLGEVALGSLLGGLVLGALIGGFVLGALLGRATTTGLRAGLNTSDAGMAACCLCSE